MKPNFDQNWTTTNGGVPLNDSEVERYIGVVPRLNQVHLAQAALLLLYALWYEYCQSAGVGQRQRNGAGLYH